VPRPNWSRPLPRTLIIPNVMTIRTLADVRDLIERHLPAETREKPSWRHLASLLPSAAAGADMVEVGVALRMVLSRGNVERVPGGNRCRIVNGTQAGHLDPSGEATVQNIFWRFRWVILTLGRHFYLGRAT
jgi:hypothetical protein